MAGVGTKTNSVFIHSSSLAICLEQVSKPKLIQTLSVCKDGIIYFVTFSDAAGVGAELGGDDGGGSEGGRVQVSKNILKCRHCLNVVSLQVFQMSSDFKLSKCSSAFTFSKCRHPSHVFFDSFMRKNFFLVLQNLNFN